VTDAVLPGATAGRGRKKTVVLGAVGAIAFGAAGFAATYFGLIPTQTNDDRQAVAEVGALPDVAFVPIDPLLISLGPAASAKHLRFVAVLEAPASEAEELRLFLPRITDVLNGYLRAVDMDVLENPATLPRLKAQMLRRIQIVTGQGRVNDLLISEFVLH
jgi:flagellar FliL protein